MPINPYTYPAGHSRQLHPQRNGLRTAFRAAAWTIAALTPVIWVLHELGALR